MGLDIYLSGRITPGIAPIGEEYTPETWDEFEIEEIRVKLGYWRKDWFLQNYMLSRYPDDEHNYEWSFGPEGLRELLGEIQAGVLNDRGVTQEDKDYPQDMFEHTVATLQRAIEWVEKCPENEWRDVVYRASW
jgi:HEPN domain-containing protein